MAPPPLTAVARRELFDFADRVANTTLFDVRGGPPASPLRAPGAPPRPFHQLVDLLAASRALLQRCDATLQTPPDPDRPPPLPPARPTTTSAAAKRKRERKVVVVGGGGANHNNHPTQEAETAGARKVAVVDTDEDGDEPVAHGSPRAKAQKLHKKDAPGRPSLSAWGAAREGGGGAGRATAAEKTQADDVKISPGAAMASNAVAGEDARMQTPGASSSSSSGSKKKQGCDAVVGLKKSDRKSRTNVHHQPTSRNSLAPSSSKKTSSIVESPHVADPVATAAPAAAPAPMDRRRKQASAAGDDDEAVEDDRKQSCASDKKPPSPEKKVEQSCTEKQIGKLSRRTSSSSMAVGRQPPTSDVKIKATSERKSAGIPKKQAALTTPEASKPPGAPSSWSARSPSLSSSQSPVLSTMTTSLGGHDKASKPDGTQDSNNGSRAGAAKDAQPSDANATRPQSSNPSPSDPSPSHQMVIPRIARDDIKDMQAAKSSDRHSNESSAERPADSSTSVAPSPPASEFPGRCDGNGDVHPLEEKRNATRTASEKEYEAKGRTDQNSGDQRRVNSSRVDEKFNRDLRDRRIVSDREREARDRPPRSSRDSEWDTRERGHFDRSYVDLGRERTRDRVRDRDNDIGREGGRGRPSDRDWDCNFERGRESREFRGRERSREPYDLNNERDYCRARDRDWNRGKDREYSRSRDREGDRDRGDYLTGQAGSRGQDRNPERQSSHELVRPGGGRGSCAGSQGGRTSPSSSRDQAGRTRDVPLSQYGAVVATTGVRQSVSPPSEAGIVKVSPTPIQAGDVYLPTPSVRAKPLTLAEAAIRRSRLRSAFEEAKSLFKSLSSEKDSNGAVSDLYVQAAKAAFSAGFNLGCAFEMEWRISRRHRVEAGNLKTKQAMLQAQEYYSYLSVNFAQFRAQEMMQAKRPVDMAWFTRGQAKAKLRMHDLIRLRDQERKDRDDATREFVQTLFDNRKRSGAESGPVELSTTMISALKEMVERDVRRSELYEKAVEDCGGGCEDAGLEMSVEFVPLPPGRGGP